MSTGHHGKWWQALRNAPKLVCLARTFPKHAEELGNPEPIEPLYFLKSTSSIIGDGDIIRLPIQSALIHHEGEIAVVIQKRLCSATIEESMRSVRGFTLLNDVTARDVQQTEGGRFCRAKSFDSFCPMSLEVLETVSWQNLSVSCSVNGQRRQHGKLTEMFMTPFALLSWLSGQVTLNAGDVVALGPPPGVGAIRHGDLLETVLYADSKPRLTLTNPVVSNDRLRAGTQA